MELIYPTQVYEATCLKIWELVEDLEYFTEGMGEVIKVIEELGVDVDNLRETQQQISDAGMTLHAVTLKLASFLDYVKEHVGNVHIIKGGDDLSDNTNEK